MRRTYYLNEYLNTEPQTNLKNSWHGAPHKFWHVLKFITVNLRKFAVYRCWQWPLLLAHNVCLCFGWQMWTLRIMSKPAAAWLTYNTHTINTHTHMVEASCWICCSQTVFSGLVIHNKCPHKNLTALLNQFLNIASSLQHICRSSAKKCNPLHHMITLSSQSESHNCCVLSQ